MVHGAWCMVHGAFKIMHYVPEVLFRLIQTFLTQDDYRYFLNSSKNLFASLKRNSIYFTLNKKQSLQYLEDTEFQNILLSKVENGWNQIGISFDSSTSSLPIPLDIPIHKIRGRLRSSERVSGITLNQCKIILL